MSYHNTIDALVDMALRAGTDELFCAYNREFQIFCRKELDRVEIFRALHYIRVRLCVRLKYPSETETESGSASLRFLEIAVGDIDAELELLRCHGAIAREHLPKSSCRWTGALVELVELVYGLQEVGCVNDGEIAINELVSLFGRIFGMEIKESHFYNAYADMKRRQNESRTYFLDKLSERLNRRMERDDENEMRRKR